MTVAIIDYGSGNLRSAAKAFEHVGGHDVLVTARAEDVLAADRVVLPGVGAFGDCRRGLLALDGMLDALEEAVIRNGRPFLGICVGMQLMATRGLEHGSQDGFGWIDGDVVAIAPDDPTLKIPHMGWNNLSSDSDHALLAGLGPEPHHVFRTQLSPGGKTIRAGAGNGRLRRRDHGDCRARQYRWNAISSGKKPGAGAAADRKLS